MSNEKDIDNAKNQAKAQYESVAEMVAALALDWERFADLKSEKDDLVEAVKDAEKAFEEARGDDDKDDARDDLSSARADLAEWEKEYGEELAELEKAAEGYDDADDARQRIEEDALSVEVRSDWVSPGEEMKAGEFRILLCTGGPAVQIRGELDHYGQPSRAWMEYQDWSTPWTQYFGADQDTLLKYCSVFYFGEG